MAMTASAVIVFTGCASGQPAETTEAPAVQLSVSEYKSRVSDIYDRIQKVYDTMDSTYAAPDATYQDYVDSMDKNIPLIQEYKDCIEEVRALVPPTEYTGAQADIISEADKMLPTLESSVKYNTIYRNFCYSFYIKLNSDHDKFKQAFRNMTDTPVDKNTMDANETEAALQKDYFTNLWTDIENTDSVVKQCKEGVYFDDPEFSGKFLQKLDYGMIACDAICGRTPPDHLRNLHQILCDSAEELKKDFEDIKTLYQSLDEINDFSASSDELMKVFTENKLEEYLKNVIDEKLPE